MFANCTRARDVLNVSFNRRFSVRRIKKGDSALCVVAEGNLENTPTIADLNRVLTATGVRVGKVVRIVTEVYRKPRRKCHS